ncbi:ATP-binding protein [Shinella sp.]|uniref:ATP-binding protein n=1 Tax=Shinella sp. TaxID=1870904 RepID=UPI00301BA9E4
MKTKVRHSGDVIRKASKTTAVLQLFSVGLLLVLVFLLADISNRYTTLQGGIRENALWSVYQLDREARRLHEALHLSVMENDFRQATLRNLATRYDILYSRIAILEKTNFESQFALDKAVDEKVEGIRRAVFGIVGTFDAIEASKPVSQTAFAGIDRILEQTVEKTDDLLLYTNNAVSIARTENRAEVLDMQVKTAGLIVLLVCCVLFLIVTLRRQLRSVKRAALDLEVLSNKLVESYQAAEAGNRAKSQFMATMGHEIRTPLNAILGTAELLELTPLPAEVEPGVQTIRRSGGALLETINEILDFAKIEYNRIDIDLRPVDLKSLAQATVEMIRDRALERGNRVELVLPGTFLAPTVEADPTRLRQVMLNLLSNAVKFTRDGTVTLRIAEQSSGGRLVLQGEVSDTGIGIDPSSMDKLFRPFSQVDASIGREYGGTGLGLTICKQIVEAMGGQIGVQSKLGEGSTFWFEVPVVPALLATGEEASGEKVEEELPVLRILLVEDNLVNQQVAAGFLRHLGQHVTIANDGLEGVQIAEAEEFDLVLMDMQMPRLDGIEAARRMRAIPGKPADLPIVALTANASDDDRRLCAEAGMTDFQSKPVTMQQLRKIIGRCRKLATCADRPTPLVPDATPAVDADAFMLRRAEMVEALGEETFAELLESFFDDAATVLSHLHDALAGGDATNIDRLLHTLKGAAASIGLTEIAAVSQDFRTAELTNGRLDQLTKLVRDNHRQYAA